MNVKQAKELGEKMRRRTQMMLLSSFIKDVMNGKYKGTAKVNIFVWILLLLYILSPIDLIPDFALGFGQLDDLIAIVYLYYVLRGDLRGYSKWISHQDEIDEEKNAQSVDFEIIEDVELEDE